MSEYQCYEFVALDRPLTAKQQFDAMRKRQHRRHGFFKRWKWKNEGARW